MGPKEIAIVAGLGVGGYFLVRYLQTRNDQPLVVGQPPAERLPTTAPIAASRPIASARQVKIVNEPVYTAREWAELATVEQIKSTPIEVLQQERAPFENLPPYLQQYIKFMNNQKWSEAFALQKQKVLDGTLTGSPSEMAGNLAKLHALYRDVR